MKDKYLRNLYRFCVSGFFIFGLMWTSSGCEKGHKVSHKEIIPITSTITENTAEITSESSIESSEAKNTGPEKPCICTE
jgi:hypothetical protein